MHTNSNTAAANTAAQKNVSKAVITRYLQIKAAAAAKAAAATTTRTNSKSVSNATKVAFLHNLLLENKYTQQQLTNMLVQQLNLSLVTAKTYITDSKNAKYCKLANLLVVTAQNTCTYAHVIAAAQ